MTVSVESYMHDKHWRPNDPGQQMHFARQGSLWYAVIATLEYETSAADDVEGREIPHAKE